MTDLSQKTILVVDDYSMNLKMAEFALKSKYNVLTAQSCSQALDVLKNNKVDLILLDILMPEMDGFEALRLLREIDGYADTPVCFLTGDEDDDTLARVNELGLSLIKKPFNPSQLIQTISELIK